ncbi:2OG-Fe(II) oxygenase [Chitinolyticbacter albus]|uniref:2OG-Fe(II) oxygenase n=1 Tax=Chitinolyticbacter albus TaxID=2961951 RepID=UPI00210B2FF2|nr:2OG-Fe(II) oxygenase [Chitinolyticbacter albus]
MTGYACVADALAEHGLAVLPDFLGRDETERLAAVCRARRERFARAGVGRADGHTVNAAIRGDDVLWLDDDDPAAASVLARLGALQDELNRSLYLGLARLECHLAAYPAGTFYKRHLDQHRGEDTRVVTIVLYLNPDWREEHGGQLRIYTEEGPHDVLPVGGTLVTFLSDRFEHEVLPATRERLSLTGWFRRRESGVL